MIKNKLLKPCNVFFFKYSTKFITTFLAIKSTIKKNCLFSILKNPHSRCLLLNVVISIFKAHFNASLLPQEEGGVGGGLNLYVP